MIWIIFHIESKVDLLHSEVKEKITTMETKIEHVEEHVEKIKIRQRSTEQKLGIDEDGSMENLDAMREYLDYNRK